MELIALYVHTEINFNKRIEALAACLKKDPSEIEHEPGYSQTMFSVKRLHDRNDDRNFYNVLNDNERFEWLKDHLEVGADEWYFDYSFLAKTTGLPIEQIKNIPHQFPNEPSVPGEVRGGGWHGLLNIISETCGLDAFTKAIAETKGYGHYLDWVTGKEKHHGDFYIYQYE